MRRKQAHLNKMQIDDIVNQLKGIRRTCKDPALIASLDAMCKKIEGIPVVDSDEVVSVDVQILNSLTKLRTAIQNGSTNLTGQLFKSIETQLAKRAEICYKSIDYPLTKQDRKLHRKRMKQNRREEKRLARELKKNGLTIEDIDEKISALEDENNRLRQECAALFDELQAGYDPVKDVQLKEKDDKIASNERKIATYTSARSRKSVAAQISDERETIEEVKKGTPTMEEVRVGVDEIETHKKKVEADNAEIEDVRQRLRTGTGSTASTPVTPAAPVAPATPVTPSAPVQTNPYAGVQNPYAGMQNPYGPSAPQRGRVEDYFEDVDEQVGLLKGTVREIEREIGKKEGKLRELSEEIRGLLQKRREASAAECVVLDGTIDSKYSAYSTVKLGIDRLNQERAKYSMELNIVEQIKDIRDAAERNERIAEMSGGRFLDIGALALAVSEDTARKNEIIAEARDAVAVANATPIDSRTFAETGVTYDTGVKDEDKYAGMEREFGLRS